MSSDEFVVTPWHVEGDIDYDKLIKQFGTQKISNDLLSKLQKITGEDHFMLRRGVFFSHRDLNLILENFEKGKEFFLYTGRGPSGHTHIGHLIPWVFAKWLQDKFNVNMYFQLTDDEKFFAKQDLSLEQTTNFALENALDFIALGFKPDKTKIIVNTKNIKTLYPIALEVAKKINFSNTKAVFGFTNETNVGMIFYTSLQSAPCFMEDKQVLIPLGVDQDPHFRITRDVAPKINKYAFSGGQPDIDEHRKIGGNPDIDVSYQYLRIFFEQDDSKLKKIYDDYKSGKMLTGELKSILIEKINAFLSVHQEKREDARKNISDYLLKD